ncbi:MAG: winged helix-turn-helix transcriptional regulator, partial [Bacteroidaceae bacterium]|nr:winged helix-turn-helix transcriptional regulator [Bacteroidaceae bacterium]
THFSRNPKIAAFLKAYHFVKEFGEGFDRICREQEANGANIPSFRTDEFILKITVPKVTEKMNVNDERVNVNVTENGRKVAENGRKVAEKVAEKHSKVTEKLRKKAAALGETLTANRIKILELMIEDPYISRAELANNVGISETSIYRNIEAMRGKYLRRVGPDKGGFWEIILEGL